MTKTSLSDTLDRVNTSLRLYSDLHRALAERAKRERRSVNSLIELILAENMARNAEERDRA